MEYFYKCKCGCEIIYNTDSTPPEYRKCYKCGEKVLMSLIPKKVNKIHRKPVKLKK